MYGIGSAERQIRNIVRFDGSLPFTTLSLLFRRVLVWRWIHFVAAFRTWKPSIVCSSSRTATASRSKCSVSFCRTSRNSARFAIGIAQARSRACSTTQKAYGFDSAIPSSSRPRRRTNRSRTSLSDERSQPERSQPSLRHARGAGRAAIEAAIAVFEGRLHASVATVRRFRAHAGAHGLAIGGGQRDVRATVVASLVIGLHAIAAVRRKCAV